MLKKKDSDKKNSFNIKALLLLIPKMFLPMAVFAIVQHFFGIEAGVASVAVMGLIGFLLREKIFDTIVKHYKVEKYSTLEAFKNKD